MQFKSFYFQFNNISSKLRNLKVVSIDDESLDSFGIEQEINEEDDGTDIPLFLGVKRKCPELTITLMKMDEWNRPLPYAEGELEEICRWLIHREYKPFISFDNLGIVYYVLFTKGESFYNGAKEGYLKFNMRLSAPYAYSNVLIDSYKVIGQRIIDIYNGSDIEEFIYPDIQFELLGDCKNITIENLTLGETMTFQNLANNEVVYVYNDKIKDVVSKVDKRRNIFKNFNRKFISLAYGKNRLRITGDCNIDIINQYPISLK